MDESLVTISEAAGMLGVSEVALRQWTDEGKIKAFVTPGGHRRYSKTDLNSFMESRQNAIGVKDLIAEIEATSQLHGKIGVASLITQKWDKKPDEQMALSLSRLGRNMLDVIIKQINEPGITDNLIQYSRECGRGFGEILNGLGLPLTDAIEAFILHRDPIIKAIVRIMEKRKAQSSTIVEMIPAVSRLMDEALLSLVASYQQPDSSPIKNGIKQA